MDILPSVRAKLEQIANESGDEVDNVITKFKEMYDDPRLSGISNTLVRQVEAARALRGHSLRKSASMAGAKDYKVIVLDKVPPTTITSRKTKEKMEVATSVMIVIRAGTDKGILAPVGFWNEEAVGVNEIEVGHIYNTKLMIRKPREGTLKGSASCSAFKGKWEDLKECNLIETINDALDKKFIRKLDIAHLAEHVGYYGMLDATVLRYYKGRDEETGREYANYTVIDESISEEYVREVGGLTCWLKHASMVKYGYDSHIYVFGQVTRNKLGDISFQADGIVPVLSFPIINEADTSPDDDLLDDDMFGEIKPSGKTFTDDNVMCEAITLKQVFMWIAALSKKAPTTGIRFRELEELAMSKGCNSYTLGLKLENLIEKGIAYEPAIGYIKLAVDEWDESYDDNGLKVDQSEESEFENMFN